jgi:hypothetical protein
MCSARIEKARLRRATFFPVASQKAGFSGSQSSIQRDRVLGGGASRVSRVAVMGVRLRLQGMLATDARYAGKRGRVLQERQRSHLPHVVEDVL